MRVYVQIIAFFQRRNQHEKDFSNHLRRGNGGNGNSSSLGLRQQQFVNRELKLPFWNGFTYIILSVLVISSAVFILSMFVWLAVKKARKATRFFVTAAAATVTFTAIVGGVAGYFMGYGFAQII